MNHIRVPSGRTYEIVSVGQGQPIIFLTGLSLTWKIWKFQISELSERYRLIFPQLPGHAGSPCIGQGFTFSDLADDLASIIELYQVEPVNLIGWCMGGNIAQLFSLRYPEKLKSMILVATTPSNAKLRGITAKDLLNYANSPMSAYELELQNCLIDHPLRDELGEKYLTILMESFCKLQYDAVLRYMDNVFRFDTTNLIKNITIPSLILSGKYDIGFPPDLVKSLHDHIPGSAYFEFEKSGHLPFITQGEIFNNKITTFIKQINEKIM
ncbi:MAG: alpha/beta hydrolase, partial [Bacteroidota bacterium]